MSHAKVQKLKPETESASLEERVAKLEKKCGEEKRFLNLLLRHLEEKGLVDSLEWEWLVEHDA